MARLKFGGFDYTFAAGNSVTGSNTFTTGVFDFAVDSGMLLQSFQNDAVSIAPGFGTADNIGQLGRNSSDGGAMGARTGAGSNNLTAFGALTQGVTCLRSTLGNPSEIWVTLDLSHSFNQNVDDPATLQRSESRCQVFKWGDLSLRLRRTFNVISTVRGDITFELFNAASSLGTITLANVNTASWMHARIHAKLDAVAGAFEVSIDGMSSNHTGINTVATTPLASATQLWFSAGTLGSYTSTLPFSFGCMDNLLIDDAAFPAGRPSGRRVAIASDNAVSGYAATSGGTLTAAVASIDTNLARGTGVGASVQFNLASVTTTGLNSNILGWQVQACQVSNVDVLAAKRIVGGIELSGTVYNGSNWASMTPPLTPSTVNPGIETVFYKGGTTDFTLSDIPNCKPRLTVANV
jgi:hypothetical protein